ncbi:MAG: hypothetical protein OXC07_02790 [Kistimonas sp.]|nr:hypothetical protein [Kistimonas sp.]
MTNESEEGQAGCNTDFRLRKNADAGQVSPRQIATTPCLTLERGLQIPQTRG